MYYRADVFTMYGMAVPRTLEDYVRASQALHGTDMNGDGETDHGLCMDQEGPVPVKSSSCGSLRRCSTEARLKGGLP